jgi:predicted flap endonuclease-1-like 5' DNA nuclease
LILIVLAGIALRYALWYRAGEASNDSEELTGLRGETESLKQQVSQLCDQKENLSHVLADHENGHTRLRDELDQLRREYDVLKDASRQIELESQADHEESHRRLQDEYDQLRQEYDALNAGRQLELESQANHEESYLRLRGEYDQLRQEYDAHNASRQLDFESQANHEESYLSLRDEYDQLRQEYDALNASRQLELESQAKHEESYLRLRDEYGQLRREYDAANASRQLELESQAKHEENYLRLRDEHDQLRSEYDALCDASHQLELQSDHQRKSVEHIEETLQGLRDDLADTSQRSDALQTELDEANATISQMRDEVDSVEELRLQLDASQDNCRELQQALDQSHESIARLEVDGRFANALREQQTSLQQSLKDRSERVQDLTGERDGLAARLEAAQSDSTQLRDEITMHEDRTEQLGEQHEDVLRQLDQGRMERQTAEEARQQAEDCIAKLREEVSRNEGIARRLRIEKEEALTRIERERNELGTTILSLRSDSDVLRQETEELRQEKENTFAELTKEQRSRQQLEESLRSHAETLDRLRADSMSFEDLLARQSDIHTLLNQHANQLRAFAGEAHEEMSNYANNEQTHSDSSPVVFSFDDAARYQATAMDDVPAGDIVSTGDIVPARDDAALGLVYETSPAYQDDLKLISGIGEILEKRLNDLGVYTYEQIMNWDQAAVNEFSTRLAFSDRIESDEWVEQARRLHCERYGKAA